MIVHNAQLYTKYTFKVKKLILRLRRCLQKVVGLTGAASCRVCFVMRARFVVGSSFCCSPMTVAMESQRRDCLTGLVR